MVWDYLSTDLLPHSIGIDGAVYGHQDGGSGRVLARSYDSGQTLDLGQNFGAAGYCVSGEYVIWCTRTTDGYVVLTSSDVSQAGNFGGVWFGASWTGPYTKVLTIRGTNEFSMSKPELHPNGHTILAFGEYSTDRPNPVHDFYVSTDGGQSWSLRRTAYRPDPVNWNAHYHGAAYDPVRHRLWSSQGDHVNSRFSYSDDDGETWTDVLLSPSHYLYENHTLGGQQPTTVMVFPDYICVSPDIGDVVPFEAGMWTAPQSDPANPRQAYKTPGPRTPSVYGGNWAPYMFGRSPYVQSGQVGVVVLPDKDAGTKKVYFAGTGDGGKTWHQVGEVDLTTSGSAGRGIVGPDANGKVFWRSLGNPAPYGDNLCVADLPTFVQQT